MSAQHDAAKLAAQVHACWAAYSGRGHLSSAPASRCDRMQHQVRLLRAQKTSAERLDGALREGEALRVEISALRQNLEKAEGDKTRVRAQAPFPHCSKSASLTLQAQTLNPSADAGAGIIRGGRCPALGLAAEGPCLESP